MPEVTSSKIDLGTDRYGRRVTATGEREGGVRFWTIRTEPSSQRDDGEIMRSLTDHNILEMAQCVEVIKRGMR